MNRNVGINKNKGTVPKTSKNCSQTYQQSVKGNNRMTQVPAGNRRSEKAPRTQLVSDKINSPEIGSKEIINKQGETFTR